MKDFNDQLERLVEQEVKRVAIQAAGIHNVLNDTRNIFRQALENRIESLFRDCGVNGDIDNNAMQALSLDLYGLVKRKAHQRLATSISEQAFKKAE